MKDFWVPEIMDLFQKEIKIETATFHSNWIRLFPASLSIVLFMNFVIMKAVVESKTTFSVRLAFNSSIK